MSVSDQDPGIDQSRVAQFNTTHWSVVLAAGHHSSPQANEALETLCKTYWYPLYAYLRRSGRDTHDAQDLTQAFFARLIEKRDFALADREKGKFRFYLLGALKHFLADEHDKATALKRGGGQTFNHGAVDLNYLSAFFLEQSRDNPAAIRQTIAANHAAGGWLIFATHDICEVKTRGV